MNLPMEDIGAKKLDRYWFINRDAYWYRIHHIEHKFTI